MKTRMVLAVLCAAPGMACAMGNPFDKFDAPQTLHVTLHTAPEGASITENGTLLGVTPLSLTYSDPALATAFEAGRCIDIKPLTAVWADGVRASANGRFCPTNGYYQEATLARPSDQGREIADAIVAAQAAANAQAAQLARQAEADRIADNNAAIISNAINSATTNYNNMLQQRQYAYPQPYPPPSAPVNCTTSVFFGQLKTVCH